MISLDVRVQNGQVLRVLLARGLRLGRLASRLCISPTHRQEVLRHLSARQLLQGQRLLGASDYDLGLLSWSNPTTLGPTPL